MSNETYTVKEREIWNFIAGRKQGTVYEVTGPKGLYATLATKDDAAVVAYGKNHPERYEEHFMGGFGDRESDRIRADMAKENTMNNETAATVTHEIELAVDQPEVAEFAAWLRQQGHDASVGRETSATVDGASTLTDADASATLAALWEEYCQS